MKIKKSSAWYNLGITDEVVNACQDESASAAKDSSSEYWNNAAVFLTEIREKTYAELTTRQRNWARAIKQDLEMEHGYDF